MQNSPRNTFFAGLLLVGSFTCTLFAQVPNPPSGSTVINRIEESTDWETCGNCGNCSNYGRAIATTNSLVKKGKEKASGR